MAEHHHQRTFDTLGVEREQPGRDERHVRDRRIGDQLLHVILHQRNEAGINHCHHRQAEDQPDQLRRGIGEHRQAEADKAIAAQLQQHTGKDHRAGSRCFDMGIGQPGVDRPHRHLDRERGKEGQEQPELHARIEIMCRKHTDIGAADFADHVDHRDEHQHRAEQRVEEEFVAGVDAPRPAPDPDDQEHRDQPGFEKHIEQEDVARRKGADHQRFHDQERRHIFGNALLNAFPTGEDAQRHQENTEQYQHQGDTIDTKVPRQIGFEQRQIFNELERRPGIVEALPEHQAENELDDSGDQRQQPCPRRIDARHCHQHGRHQHRQQDHGGKQHQRPPNMKPEGTNQATAAASPISMTSA